MGSKKLPEIVVILFLMATELKEGDEAINRTRQRLGSALEILVKPELKKQKLN